MIGFKAYTIPRDLCFDQSTRRTLNGQEKDSKRFLGWVKVEGTWSQKTEPEVIRTSQSTKHRYFRKNTWQESATLG